MHTSRKLFALVFLVVLALAVSACAVPAAPIPAEEGAAAEPAAEAEGAASAGALQIPEPDPDKFNVAFVFVGPIGDGGWTYAHNEGRLYVEEQMGDAVHTAYLESVPEGADAERVIRNLARAGFDAIFTTSFGYHGSAPPPSPKSSPTATLSMSPATRRPTPTSPTSLAAWRA